MRIRRATAEDLDSLVAMSREVQALHRAARPGSYRDPTDEELAAYLRQQLGRHDAVIVVAEGDAGVVVGHLVMFLQAYEATVFAPGRRQAYVAQLAVRAGARRTGHGRRLMEAAGTEARAWGATQLALDVQSFNDDALRFYRALGYETSATRLTRPL